MMIDFDDGQITYFRDGASLGPAHKNNLAQLTSTASFYPIITLYGKINLQIFNEKIYQMLGNNYSQSRTDISSATLKNKGSLTAVIEHSQEEIKDCTK